MRRMSRHALALLVLLAVAAAARAGEVLKLRNGDLIPGEVVELDADGVLFARERGERLRVGWGEVLPISRYELWSASLAADDAAGRLEVARWALEMGLFHQARREAQRCAGLAGDDAPKAKELLAEIARAEADTALAEIDARLEADDVDGALDEARRYLRIAPPGDDADRVRARVPDLLERIERRDALEREKAEEEERAAKSGRKQAWIDENFRAAQAQKREGEEQSIDAFANLAKGNQTRARRALTAAEKAFAGARDTFKRVARTAGPGETTDACKREMQDCDRRTVTLLGRWGTMEVENKAWRRASDVVDRGLRIDPVDTTLLELRKTIDENWIRRRVSDITNASGHESSQ